MRWFTIESLCDNDEAINPSEDVAYTACMSGWRVLLITGLMAGQKKALYSYISFSAIPYRHNNIVISIEGGCNA